MPTTIPLRTSLPAPSRTRTVSVALPWSGRQVLCMVLGLWATVTALLAAALVAIVWDLRS